MMAGEYPVRVHYEKWPGKYQICLPPGMPPRGRQAFFIGCFSWGSKFSCRRFVLSFSLDRDSEFAT